MRALGFQRAGQWAGAKRDTVHPASHKIQPGQALCRFYTSHKFHCMCMQAVTPAFFQQALWGQQTSHVQQAESKQAPIWSPGVLKALQDMPHPAPTHVTQYFFTNE